MTFFLVELKVTSWIAILVHHWIKYNLINAMPSEQLTNKWYFIKITARLQFTMKIFLFAGIIERLLHLVNRNRKSNDPQLLFFFHFFGPCNKNCCTFFPRDRKRDISFELSNNLCLLNFSFTRETPEPES